MTPKEKANDLFYKISMANQEDYCSLVKEATKSQCFILCDEVLENLENLCISHLGTYNNPKIRFWMDVKQEIEKL